MIKNTEQSWQVGQIVKVGIFGSKRVPPLKVIEVKRIKDNLPDIHILESLDGSRRYEFIPYNGLSKLDSEGRPVKKIPKIKRRKVSDKHEQHK